MDNVSYRWCAGTDHVIFDDRVSVPLRASTALQSADLAFELFSLQKAEGTGMSQFFSLDCICFLTLHLVSFSRSTRATASPQPQTCQWSSLQCGVEVTTTS